VQTRGAADHGRLELTALIVALDNPDLDNIQCTLRHKKDLLFTRRLSRPVALLRSMPL
jgi:hypothetical protein